MPKRTFTRLIHQSYLYIAGKRPFLSDFKCKNSMETYCLPRIVNITTGNTATRSNGFILKTKNFLENFIPFPEST